MTELPDCPACHGTGLVTDEEYDEIVAALLAIGDADE
jgi:hypothetical protein